MVPHLRKESSASDASRPLRQRRRFIVGVYICPVRTLCMASNFFHAPASPLQSPRVDAFEYSVARALKEIGMLHAVEHGSVPRKRMFSQLLVPIVFRSKISVQLVALGVPGPATKRSLTPGWLRAWDGSTFWSLATSQ